MSYQVLARKWRPRSFATLVGQEHVVRALTHALSTGRLHHAYLFTGTRGVGKTTISRILAKSLNCEQGITATPCGQCAACTEIDTGRFVDYVEMDAASNRGVDDMAALLEKAAYAPSRGRYKVYMIDEVHMLTGHAFNAMLKTLEEPPEHMKFILATTDPQKIPVTVLSRCLQFNLKQMPQTHIVEHLSNILGQEGVTFEPGALRHIAKGANGSMRDALSLLDQAIAHGAGKVEEQGVRDMLGTVGEDHLYALLDALHGEDAGSLLGVADGMAARSLNFDSALQEFAVLLHRVALTQFAPQAIADPLERERLLPYAAAFTPEFLQLAYQICIHSRDELALAPDEYTGFTMGLLRLHAFRPALPGASVAVVGAARPLPVIAAAPAAEAVRPEPVVVTPAPEVAAARALHVAEPEPVLPPYMADPEPAAPDPAPVAASEEPSSHVPPDGAGLETAPAVAPAAVMAPEAALDWHGIIQGCGVGGMVRELAQNCELLERDGTLLHLRLAATHRHLNAMPSNANKLQEVLSAYFGQAMRVTIEVGDVQSETPAQRDDAARRLAHAEAVASLETDPFVQELVERFDATLVESSVKPLSGENP
ncbi:MAG: DNA polymerase III subunit gamma/tau [Candidatus Dactylopiibacterium carminicum]|uniref:DNA polymerase III subunit gamma/tau n=1 Tax=Candidatus Dactylopiibacterium carminicum TaxID=857335 RepID=A0A272EP69_9RHOO|nr:DNA polymerase III subunit gamma/tau [Candidatus Dactylopiibacterium carminicum]KAF7598293.1 DNA polymerase III subunit gamma/tau [Candidatus Dactylopiibacterium carminicum]PAS91909.1 MAG: DNA polymerase III subunit gamma/tau [Candidatus Dactylopiibacterium carminicum]PAS94965.1 MAG: DNA polymerase III subunit gamma/tau [Candidatus Dactylopiibacterium carminicum]PAS97225.1 MAG: DNA polymerase III, subunit gamma and tau [Candidatus Dactylopiibacterium carminicum]